MSKACILCANTIFSGGHAATEPLDKLPWDFTVRGMSFLLCLDLAIFFNALFSHRMVKTADETIHRYEYSICIVKEFL